MLRNIGGAVRMGLAWAAVWAPVAVLIGAYIVDPDNSMDEMWILVGAFPAFLSGVIFFTLLRIADGRRFDNASLFRIAMWGALSGLMVGVIPFALATPKAGLAGLAIIGSITLLSSVSAVGSALLNGRGKR